MSVERAFEAITDNPLGYGVTYRDTRAALVPGFPYAASYRVLRNRVGVVAVHHTSRVAESCDWGMSTGCVGWFSKTVIDATGSNARKFRTVFLCRLATRRDCSSLAQNRVEEQPAQRGEAWGGAGSTPGPAPVGVRGVVAAEGKPSGNAQKLGGNRDLSTRP